MCVLYVSEMVKVLIYTDMVVALRQQRYLILQGSPIWFMNKKVDYYVIWSCCITLFYILWMKWNSSSSSSS